MDPVNSEGRRPAKFEIPVYGMRPGQPIGLGSILRRMTSAVGIQPCGGCKKRAEKLDKVIAFGRGSAPEAGTTLAPVTKSTLSPVNAIELTDIHAPYQHGEIERARNSGPSIHQADKTRHLTITIDSGPKSPSLDTSQAKADFLSFLKEVSSGHNRDSKDQKGKSLEVMDGFPPGDVPPACDGTMYSAGTWLKVINGAYGPLTLAPLMEAINVAANAAYTFALADHCPSSGDQYCDHQPPEQGFVYAFAVGFFAVGKDRMTSNGRILARRVVYAMAQVRWGCKEMPGLIFPESPDEVLPPVGGDSGGTRLDHPRKRVSEGPSPRWNADPSEVANRTDQVQ